MRTRITRALISVSDKTHIAELAKALDAAGVEIVSTGSTARSIRDAGVAVTPVEEVTGVAEFLDGRVKTLHPAIHGGILADRRRDEHLAALQEREILPFDLVVVNLYPFQQTAASGAEFDEVIEQIDIGGPALLRASAKNHASVSVVCDPADYEAVISVLPDGFDAAARRRLAAKAFAHTASYDVGIATWMQASTHTDLSEIDASTALPPFVGVALERAEVLRYGENPHQSAALYVAEHESAGVARADQLGGKPMSYNNYVDADSAVAAVSQFDAPSVAVIKHTNPCGIASAETIAEAYKKAHATDPLSAFGGVIAANAEVDAEMAAAVTEVFTEVIIAPSFTREAVEILTRKKNLRILHFAPDNAGCVMRPISGGALLQTADTFTAAGDDPAAWQLVSGDAADDATLRDLSFAWRAVQSVRSNAVLLATDTAAVGVGMGQVNRVDSAHLAVRRAGERSSGSVAASDAFFPFPDGLEVLLNAGVRAVVQPGGSKRDDEVIAAARERGVSMYLTGARHFLH